MKYLILLALVLLTGCQSLQYAGSSKYQMRQFTDDNGKPAFDLYIWNGKEVKNVTATLKKTGDDIEVTLVEADVSAFSGQQIAANAAKITAESAVKAAVAAGLGMATGGALPVVAGIMQGGGLGAGILGAGVGAAGALKAHDLLTPKTSPIVDPLP